MHMADIDTNRWNQIRDVVADALEIEPEEIDADSHFRDDLDADSLTGIEILAALERRFDIVISHNNLDEMTTLSQAYRVVTDVLASR
jgi:acyl carrier protein